MDELAKRFADLAAQYGPAVADAAKAAARTGAFSSLVGSIIPALIAVVALWATRFLWLKAKSVKDDMEYPFVYVASCVCACIGVGCALGAIWAWIDPWTWTTINHPELWIAKKAFHI